MTGERAGSRNPRGDLTIRIDQSSRKPNHGREPVQVLYTCLEWTGPEIFLVFSKVSEKAARRERGRMHFFRIRRRFGLRRLAGRSRRRAAGILYCLGASPRNHAGEQDQCAEYMFARCQKVTASPLKADGDASSHRETGKHLGAFREEFQPVTGGDFLGNINRISRLQNGVEHTS